MAVSTLHSKYSENIAKIRTVRDCVEGSRKIKQGKELYLPKPNPDDVSEENRNRYIDYITRANFINFTGHTLEGLLGMVFRKDPEIKLPSSIEYLIDNADGNGLSLKQVGQSVVSEIAQAGRHGLLTDYPQAESGLTKSEVTNLGLLATIKSYKAESIINWRTITRGSTTMLSLVVLLEPTEVIKDSDNEVSFDIDVVDYYRVLYIDKGVYKQRLYDNNEKLIQDEIIPNNERGEPWNLIPFVFVGSEENDVNIDKIPIYDIAEINISHYRNSADFEESSYQIGQPTPVLSGLNQNWVDENMKGGVMLGSRSAILLPEGGGSSLLQANPNQMPERGMEMKEAQMVMIGARIIQDMGGNETVDAASMRNAGQNSKLSLIVTNTRNALMQCLAWATEYMGGDPEQIELEFNKQFYDKSIDPQAVIADIQLLDRGVIAKKDLRRNLRKADRIADDRTDEDIDSEAQASSPIE